MVKEHVLEARQAKEEHDQKGTRMDTKVSVFRYIMGSDLPESERSDERLGHEGQVFFAGGTATVARTLTFISYYILSRPHIQARLQQELQDSMATYPERVPSWIELERLPYLQAVIKEGLRFVPTLTTEIALSSTTSEQGSRMLTWPIDPQVQLRSHAPASPLLARRPHPVQGMDNSQERMFIQRRQKRNSSSLPISAMRKSYQMTESTDRF